MGWARADEGPKWSVYSTDYYQLFYQGEYEKDAKKVVFGRGHRLLEERVRRRRLRQTLDLSEGTDPAVNARPLRELAIGWPSAFGLRASMSTEQAQAVTRQRRYQ
jgi:hypothetical protein